MTFLYSSHLLQWALIVFVVALVLANWRGHKRP